MNYCTFSTDNCIEQTNLQSKEAPSPPAQSLKTIFVELDSLISIIDNIIIQILMTIGCNHLPACIPWFPSVLDRDRLEDYPTRDMNEIR